MQSRQVLTQHFPGMEVLGSAYPVPPYKVCHQIFGSSCILLERRAWRRTVKLIHDTIVQLLQAFMSKIVMVAQYGTIGALLGGEQLFAALGMPVPELYQQYKDKKTGIVMGVWLLGNALQNQLISTGAFEVFYDGERVSGDSLNLLL